MDIKKCVKDFKKKFSIDCVTVENLRGAIEKQGFTIVEFDFVNSGSVNILIQSLGLAAYVNSCKCFTYQDDKYRLLFINRNLNDDEQLIVLCHEEGHIFLNHMVQDNIFGTDVIQEYQANEFAHFLLERGSCVNKKTVVLSSCATIVIILSIIFAVMIHDKRVYTDNYFRTESGAKYHIDGCVYLKNKKGVKKLTETEFESGEYEPCSVCIQFENK